MSRLLAIAAIALLGTAGCSITSLSSVPGCVNDNECGEGKLCFPEGCGAPDTGIVIEVTANTGSGHHAQDFAVTNLAVIQNVEVFPPISVAGEILQRVYSPQIIDDTQPYRSQVTLLASGESLLIPGVTRRYQASFASLEQGAYSMFVGAGKYTLSATAADTSVPADSYGDVRVVPGTGANQTFVFQSPETAVALAGLLIKTPGVAPDRDTLLPVKMEVQVFDPVSRRALSQRTPVTKDDGSFTLWIDPAVEKLETFQLVATPADPLAVAPSKTFLLTRPLEPQLVLKMGAFSQSLPGISGKLVDADGAAVAGATVFIEGPVEVDGATYRTRAVISDEQGVFRVEAFLTAPGKAMTLTAIPQATGPVGMFRGPVKVLNQNVEHYLEPNTFTCPPRVTVTGLLSRPDGTPAAMALVVAEPTSAIDGKPLPPGVVEEYTDEEGRYSLLLDPAEYRLDFLPGEGLPRRSILVSVHAVAAGSVPKLELDDFTLSNGRTISGSITSPHQPLVTTSSVVPNASVRFFRTTAGGKARSVLLAETVADERGNYKVVLPVAAPR